LNFKLTLPVEGQFTEVTETPDHYSNRPDITWEGVVATLSNNMAFRRSEAGGTFAIVEACHTKFEFVPRNSEISELNFSRFAVKKYVVRLDVAMDYLLCPVKVNDSSQ
jgi:hypothetical protein